MSRVECLMEVFESDEAQKDFENLLIQLVNAIDHEKENNRTVMFKSGQYFFQMNTQSTSHVLIHILEQIATMIFLSFR